MLCSTNTGLPIVGQRTIAFKSHWVLCLTNFYSFLIFNSFLEDSNLIIFYLIIYESASNLLGKRCLIKAEVDSDKKQIEELENKSY